MSSPESPEPTECTLSVAERFYNQHKKRVLQWQKMHPEQCSAKAKRYISKMRIERPEQYNEYKSRNRVALALRRAKKKQESEGVQTEDVHSDSPESPP